MAHKIELRPTPEQADDLNRACGTRRHCCNQLLAHFSQEDLRWSKAAAYQHDITVIRVEYPWYAEVSGRVARNAIDDLDHAFKHFFRRVKAKAKLKVAKLQARISNQRQAVLHELSDKLTRTYHVITIEDLNVEGMVKNRSLARAVSDAGFGELRRQIEYKAQWRGVTVVIADRWFPSSKTCHACGRIHDMPLSQRTTSCDCGNVIDRDLNAALNLNQYGRDALKRDLRRTQESGKTASFARALTA